MLILALFLIWKIIDFFTSFFSVEFIKNLGWFPYRDLINSYHILAFLTSFANFDGAHYISIAKNNYAQFEQAFFPLYPILIKILSPIFSNNHLITGFVISNIAFVIGLFFFKKYLNLLRHAELVSASQMRSRNKFGMTKWPLVFLLAFPTSFFFGAVYTEGLFFMFIILAFYFLKKDNYYLAGIFAFFASLTRLVGVFLIIPIIINILSKSKKTRDSGVIRPKVGFPRMTSFWQTKPGTVLHLAKCVQNLWFDFRNLTLGFGISKFIVLILPILGLGIYSIYLFYTTGDPLYFFHAQSSFGLNRSTNIILFPQVFYRYFKIFITAQHNFQYFIALFEFAVFNFALVILTLDLKKNLSCVIPHLPLSSRAKTRNPVIPGFLVKPGMTEKQNKKGSRDKGRDDKCDRLGLNLFSFSNLMLATFTGTFLSIPRFALLSLSIFIFLGEIKNKPIKIGIAAIFILLHIIIFSFFTRGYFVS